MRKSIGQIGLIRKLKHLNLNWFALDDPAQSLIQVVEEVRTPGTVRPIPETDSIEYKGPKTVQNSDSVLQEFTQHLLPLIHESAHLEFAVGVSNDHHREDGFVLGRTVQVEYFKEKHIC